MRIAVIGTGISGAGAAWLLKDRHSLTVYEQGSRVGGHTNTVTVDDPRGAVGVDTGFIVYNERNYPLLSTLFRLLDVETQASDMSFAASLDGGRIEYAGDAMFAQRRNLVSLSHWRMLRDIVRFNRVAKASLSDPSLERDSIGDFLRHRGFGEELGQRYLLPMAAAIWSCPPARMMDFPAAALLRFFENHGLLDLTDRPRWRTVVGGSQRYMEKLTSGLHDDIRVGCAATAVVRKGQGVQVRDAQGQWADYDRVFVATHADQALALLQDADELERALLSPFGYQRNLAILHSDPALMPRRRAAWSSWNYLARGKEGLSVTYWMNRLQRLEAERDYFVTLNPVHDPDPASVHYQVEYMHPVFDGDAMRAQRSLGLLQGRGNVWFCGSYFGFGFHEDGFGSAVEAVLAAGEEIPRALLEARATTPPYRGNRLPWLTPGEAVALGR
jgi:uncharacterized protein